MDEVDPFQNAGAALDPPAYDMYNRDLLFTFGHQPERPRRCDRIPMAN